jgi:hypothetical protein
MTVVWMGFRGEVLEFHSLGTPLAKPWAFHVPKLWKVSLDIMPDREMAGSSRGVMVYGESKVPFGVVDADNVNHNLCGGLVMMESGLRTRDVGRILCAGR